MLGFGATALMGIEQQRLDRLRATMAGRGVTVLLTADPIDILYATGIRNMTIFSMMGPSRFALIPIDGEVIVWEFQGSEHIVNTPIGVEVRTAPGITPLAGPGHLAAIEQFAHDVADVMRDRRLGDSIAVERFDMAVTDALRRRDLTCGCAGSVFVEARRLKTPAEIDAMWASMSTTTAAVEAMRAVVAPGRTEVEVWSEFHRHLIAGDGEYVSTRLVQSGDRTFPYFHEATTRTLRRGDLFCIDTDAIGPGSYAADFSRTFVCGDVQPTDTQRHLHELAECQLEHNAALIEPGRTFASFAESAWCVPERHRPFGYSCLAHGLGLCGEYPYLPVSSGAEPYPLDDEFEPGMVMCVESYIGDPVSGQGVKLEDQYLVTADGTLRMSGSSRSMTV